MYYKTGLRDDFGIRLKSAVETMREIGPDKSSDQPRRGYMNILQSQNRGVEERAKRDTEAIEVLRAYITGYNAILMEDLMNMSTYICTKFWLTS